MRVKEARFLTTVLNYKHILTELHFKAIPHVLPTCTESRSLGVCLQPLVSHRLVPLVLEVLLKEKNERQRRNSLCCCAPALDYLLLKEKNSKLLLINFLLLGVNSRCGGGTVSQVFS